MDEDSKAEGGKLDLHEVSRDFTNTGSVMSAGVTEKMDEQQHSKSPSKEPQPLTSHL